MRKELDNNKNLEIAPEAPKEIITERLILRQISSMEEHIAGKETWEKLGEGELKMYQNLNEAGYYNHPTMFTNYNVYIKDTNELIGQVGLSAVEKNNRLAAEAAHYYSEAARGKGYGPEVLIATKEHLLNPSIGKRVTYPKIQHEFKGEYVPDPIEIMVSEVPLSMLYGVVEFMNYPSVSACNKAGWDLHFVYVPNTSLRSYIYTTYKAPLPSLSSEGTNSIKNITQIFDKNFEAFERLSFKERCESLKEELQPNLKILLNDKDPISFVSALKLYKDIFNEEPKIIDLENKIKACNNYFKDLKFTDYLFADFGFNAEDTLNWLGANYPEIINKSDEQTSKITHEQKLNDESEIIDNSDKAEYSGLCKQLSDVIPGDFNDTHDLV
jgi:Fe-S-cluster containining protein